MGPIGCPVVVSSPGRFREPASAERRGLAGFGLSLCRQDSAALKHTVRRGHRQAFRYAVEIISASNHASLERVRAIMSDASAIDA
jgi:hypothetical protein